MKYFASARHQELLGIGDGGVTMNINESDHGTKDICLAGTLAIALVSMIIGVLLGFLIAS
jgi:hypothetical protein